MDQLQVEENVIRRLRPQSILSQLSIVLDRNRMLPA